MINTVIKKSFFLVVVYWILMITLGYEASFYTYKFVNNLDLSLLSLARDFLLLSLFFFIGSGLLYFYSCNKEGVDSNDTFSYQFQMYPFWFSFLICSYIFYITYSGVGYIPLFHLVPGAKYFQDVSEIYISFRPLYTFAVNLSVASIMALIIVYFYADSKKNKQKIMMLLFLFTIMLVLTGKRGAILLPFAYIIFGMFLVGYLSIYKSGALFCVLIILAGVLHLIFNQQSDLLIGLMDSLSNSFFVGVRELGRFFSNFNNEYLNGLSYLAGGLSFIPTEYSEIKDLYLYPRYLIYLEGGNPDLSGGPRGTFIGEAYANFGVVGVILMSSFFGLFFSFIFKVSLLPKIFRGNLKVIGFMSAFILHQCVLAFFENGSAFMFHYFSKYIFVYLLLFSAVTYSTKRGI